LLIDPKGDLGNLLLTFPNLPAGEFKPWIQEDQARAENMTVDELAAQKASQWAKGLADWDITTERLQTLKDAADITLYTPGSESGVPVSVLASLRAPKDGFDANPEANREQIGSLVTAILALAGISAEPLSDPRHVLLSNIFEHNWRAGQDLSLETLIMQTQKPPFDRLGVMSVNDFFPERERFALAMALNAVIASPSFQAWGIGAPMDVHSLLYSPEGKPRVAIFNIAHLNDNERMFAMTLILETLLNWTRRQAGTESLRAILYIDEIFGYFPPTANPPSKQPLLRLLKQARAFGVGVVLATQNPVDLDYKGLANIGTWWIGRLQTDNDRARVVAGLKEAAATSDMDMDQVNSLIANLKSRIFLMRNIHDKGVPTLFSSRWAMNYLAGPLTRQQIAQLMADRKTQLASAGASQGASTLSTASAVPDARASDLPPGFSATPPIVKDAQQFYLGASLNAREAIQKWEDQSGRRAEVVDDARLAFVPALLAQATVRYEDSKAGLRVDQQYTFVVPDVEPSGFLRWEDYAARPIDKRRLDVEPRGEALFGALSAALTDKRRLRDLESDLLDTIYKSYTLKVQYNRKLNVFASRDEQPGEFEARLRQAARELRDQAVDDITAKYDKRFDTLQERLARKERDVREDEQRVSSSNTKDIADIALGVFDALTGRRRSSSLSRIGRAATKAMGTSTAEAALEKSRAEFEAVQAQLNALEQEMKDELADVERRFDAEIARIEDYEISPKKSNIALDIFALGWLPHWLFMAEGRVERAPAYETE
jgi:hypothetical protein